MGKRLKVYDRSRSTTDWTCKRKRYLQYEHLGRGIVPETQAIELYLGTTLHDGLAAIARNVPIDDIATAAQTQVFNALKGELGLEEDIIYANEQAALIEGLLRGFHRHVWPSLIGQYPKILAIEQEMVYEHDGFRFMSKPDLVLSNDEGSDIIYVEYKSTSSKTDNWVNSWSYAVQLHSTIRAIEASLGVKATGVIVQGLYKGFQSYGKQSSPFCYSYSRSAAPPFIKAEVAYEYKAGLKRAATWDQPGGVKEWVKGMPENILADQFPRTPVIFIKDDLIDDFFAQRAVRESEIDMAMQMLEAHADDPETIDHIMNTSFDQRFDQCVPYFGKACSYRPICFGTVTDPLQSGFSLRESHHQLEAEHFNGQDLQGQG